MTLPDGDVREPRHSASVPGPPPHASRAGGEVLAIVLAAGAGRRFGPAVKQLAELEGRPLVCWAVDAARGGGADRIVVVAGHRAAQVRAAVHRRCAAGSAPVEVVVNADHATGQGSSLAVGVERVLAAAPDAVGVVVLLADQPGVRAEAVRAVAEALRGGAVAARARYDDGPSHPVGLSTRVLPRLLAGSGDQGARWLLGELDVVAVDVEGRAPRDVDTPADLSALGGAPGLH